jgi:hypothetical protein
MGEALAVKYRTIVLLALVAFAVSLAVVVGQRLSSEAMAVIIGVVAGVAASIPTSLIVVWFALRSRSGETRVVEERRPEPVEPKIVVVTPPMQNQGYGQPAGGGWSQPYEPQLPAAALPRQPMQRHFTVIGGEADVV